MSAKNKKPVWKITLSAKKNPKKNSEIFYYAGTLKGAFFAAGELPRECAFEVARFTVEGDGA